MKRTNIEFIILAKAIAILIVIYAHIQHLFNFNNQQWIILDFVKKNITIPLAITSTFGFIGVIIFFLCSGFTISRSLEGKSRLSFLIRRVLRIYPPFIFSLIVLISLSFYYPEHSLVKWQEIDLSAKSIFFSFSLLNYFSPEQNIVNGVAWILPTFILFYISVLVLLPIFQKKPSISILILLSASFLTTHYSSAVDKIIHGLSWKFAYIPYFVLGQLLYFSWTKKIKTSEFFLLNIFAYTNILYGIVKVFRLYYPTDNSYGVSATYAYFIFMILFLVNSRLKIPKLFTFLSNTSYSIYLLHAILHHFMYHLFLNSMNTSIGVILYLLTLPVVGYLSYKLIEYPMNIFSHQLIRKISKKY